VAVLAGSLAGCDFIQPITEDPNQVPVAQLDQLLVGLTVNNYFMEESQVARMVNVWLQSMDGTDRQYSNFSQYIHDEESDGDIMNNMYTTGGLIDIRNGQDLATEQNLLKYRGIFKVYEAWIMGMAASEYGDLPYSEAVAGIEQPALDEQRAIYTAILALLDDAISDLNAGSADLTPAGVDFAYGGNASQWIAAANLLKARFNLHWVEVEGNARYSDARTAALAGITDASGNMYADHSTSEVEQFFWRQFMRERSGYMVAGVYLTNWMNTNSDTRMRYYYSYGSGSFTDTVIGSPPGASTPGDPGTSASELACGVNNTNGCLGFGMGLAEFDYGLLTCHENYFILAEAEYMLGDEAAARTALDNALDCNEDMWVSFYGITAVDLDAFRLRNDAMAGATLLTEIMEQKYAAQFLNRDIWNDWKRMCTPGITPFDYPNQTLPGRMYYSNDERESNVNVPDVGDQPVRNDNDPAACP
jgi:hypothetical protein